MWIITFLLIIEALLVVFLALFFRSHAKEVISQVNIRLEKMEETIRTRRISLHEKESEDVLLEQHLSEIIELYELTKKVSASLELQEVVMTLSQTLEANFSFEKGFLFLLRDDSDRTHTPQDIDRIYALPANAKSLPEKGLVTVKAEDISYLAEMLEAAREKKEAFQGSSFPFTAVPLWVKHRLISLIVCEHLKPEDLEKLTILSRQFALAIQKVKLYGKIQELAITDGLTRLYTRRYFLERFHEELTRSKRHHLSLSFLMADIDFFKEKNDQYGHLVGDVILREVASQLKANVREIDLVGRYGGEEFFIALPETGL
ncbi:diguanylate cyclase, partial [candidate division TA06 bacterium]|nr:diguanylate cyclase [candidate division TA06 bacterium]